MNLILENQFRGKCRAGLARIFTVYKPKSSKYTIKVSSQSFHSFLRSIFEDSKI